MAASPAHTWGQILGNAVELGVVPVLSEIADEFDLYLDSPGQRKARKGKKVSWLDKYGNKHDLDYVLERGGTEERVGTPVGFVEVAWRRYTKHSKNKAQEIQGAVMPIVETHGERAPFMGAILAGMFTSTSLEQLRSLGFHVLYFPYEKVVASFAAVGIDAASDEDTDESEFEAKILAWQSLTQEEQGQVVHSLLASCLDDVKEFSHALRQAIGRTVERVVVLPLFGSSSEFSSLSEALSFLELGAVSPHDSDEFVRIEVEVRYSNGDSVAGSFGNADSAASFLRLVATN